MTVGARSYGTVATVATLTPRFANGSGAFDATTRPTITTVESQIDQVSALLNTVLAEQGFSVPVSQADCLLMLAMFVTEEVAAIVEGINGSGRFGPGQPAKGSGKGRFALIMGDVETFVSANANGMERLGATRTQSLMEGIAYRDTDESGAATFPIFQRKSFGGETFTDADQ